MIKKLSFIRGMQLEVRLEEDSTYTLRQNNSIIGVSKTYEEALSSYNNYREDLIKKRG